MVFVIFVLLLTAAGIARSQSSSDPFTFPKDFKFGAGTSAYQIEGAWNQDGKGRSYFDWLLNQYPMIVSDKQNGNVACSSYYKYKEDVSLMKEIGLDFYRFSLAWSRILPNGFSNKVNQAGVDYYNNLLDELEAAGIEPMVTIFHWDTPMALEHLGAYWTNSRMVDYFVAYADLAFSLFGNRVKLWGTINEPIVTCQLLPTGLISLFPELPLGTLEYTCAHNVVLAHAKAYRLYQEKYKATQNGRIAITLDLNHHMPLTDSPEDKESVERINHFKYGWFAHPLVYGDYPRLMKDVIAKNSANQNFSSSRLPRFSCKEKLMIKGTYDLFTVNSYTAFQVTPDTYLNSPPSFISDLQIRTVQPDHWLTTAVSNLRVYPEGIRYVLKYIKENYKDPEIIITENGYSDTTGVLYDTNRISFIRDTLYQIRLAMIEDGVKVTRYTYWSLMDNLEWLRGFQAKFGLIHVNFDDENRTRTLKESAYYYQNLVQTHNINVTSSRNLDNK